MKQKPFTSLAILVFLLVGAAHLLRLLFGWEVLLQGSEVPMSASVLGVLVAGVLAVGLWREVRRGGP